MTTEDRELFEKLCVATSAKGDSTWQQNVTWARVGLEAIRAAEGEATAPVTLTIRDAPPMHVGSFTYSAKTGEWESPRTSHLVAEVEALTEELSSWKRRAIEAESCAAELRADIAEVHGIGRNASQDDPRGANDEDPLTNIERRIYDYVKAHDGCHFDDIIRETGLFYIQCQTALYQMTQSGAIERDYPVPYLHAREIL